MSAPHALVVGAGLFGLTGARALRDRGWRVTVVDPGPVPRPAAASTDISKLVRAAYGADAFYSTWMTDALAGWRALNAEAGEPLFHEDGVVFLSRGPLDAGGFEAESLRTLSAGGHAVERLDAATIHARFDAFARARFTDGFFERAAGWAESGRVIAWLADRAVAEGVTLRQGVQVAAPWASGLEVHGVVTATGERLAADHVLLAAGAWTPDLWPPLAASGVGLRRVAQPILVFQANDARRFAPPHLVPWAADIAETGFYGFPALPDGRVKIGHHGRGFDAPLDGERPFPADAEPRFRAFLRETIPGLADAPIVERRVCQYCDSPDGDFVIARDPERPRLTVASGGSGHAFKLAPVLGAVIADAVEGVQNPRLGRLSWGRGSTGRREQARAGS